MKSILTKEEQDKIKIFFYLVNLNEGKRIQEIEKYSGLSYYKVSKLLDSLNTDVKNYYSDGYCLVCKDSSGSIYIENKSSFLLNILISNYYKNSLQFKLLEQILFSDEKYSVTKFANDNYLSLSYAYTIANSLENFLNDYGLSLDGKLQIVGEELSVRNLLYSIYINIFRTEEFLFPKELYQKVERLTQKTETYFNLHNLTSQDRKKIKYYVTIGIIRVNNGFYVSNEIFADSDKMNNLAEYLKDNFHLSEKNACTWFKEIKYFLETENILFMTTTLINSRIISNVYSQSMNVIKELNRKDFFFKKKTNHDFGFLKIKNFVQHTLLMYNNRIDYLFFVDEFYLDQFFPDKKNLIHQLLETSCVLFPWKEQSKYIVFDFLLLIDELFENTIRSEVKIKFDISDFSKYQNLFLSKLNVPDNVVLFSTPFEPDILVTDRKDDIKAKSRAKIVFWSYPPSIHDLRRLQETLDNFSFVCDE